MRASKEALNEPTCRIGNCDRHMHYYCPIHNVWVGQLPGAQRHERLFDQGQAVTYLARTDDNLIVE